MKKLLHDPKASASKEDFFLVTRTSLQAAWQEIVSAPTLSGSCRLDRTMIFATLVSEALAVADRIPEGMSVIDAVRDFIAYATDAGPTWNDPPEREIPAKWMGLNENFYVQSFFFNGVQTLIDGRWQAENPAWKGLLFNDSATLRVLSHLKANGPTTRNALRKILFAHQRKTLDPVLTALEKTRWLTRSLRNGEEIWSATAKLVPPPTDPILVQKPPRDRKAEWEKARDERHLALPYKPNSQVILRALRKMKRAPTRELQPLVAGLDRNGTVRLLKQLRLAGWVEVVGEGRNALWKLTTKKGSAKGAKKKMLQGPTERIAVPLEVIEPVGGIPFAFERKLPLQWMVDAASYVPHILKLLKEHPGCSIGPLNTRFPGLDAKQMSALIKELHRQQLVHRSGHGIFAGRDLRSTI